MSFLLVTRKNKLMISKALLSLAAPLLILVAILGLFQRQSSDRLQVLPAIIVGTGLIISGAFSRGKRRRNLLTAIRKKQTNEDDLQ